MIIWFQTPSTATVTATWRLVKPQARSMPKETAMPGAAPPGAM